MVEGIREELFRLQDTKFREFLRGLTPTVSPDSVIGVRTPALRAYARQLSGHQDVQAFLRDLPHCYFEENQLHAFIISGMKDFETCIRELCAFLPYVDNWATCDQMSPKVFKKHRAELLEYIRDWLASDRTYTVRFGVGMLMEHFLDEDFDLSFPETVASLRSEEYYVNMMIAWYFATALAKQYDSVLPFLEGNRLDRWTHNRTIQKALESYRISDGRKEYLRGLKRK